jgi:hypothetical protein
MIYLLVSIAIVCLAIIIILLIIYKRRFFRSPESVLRVKIKKLLNTEDKKAEMIIDDYTNRLKERIPGKSDAWYLEKMLYDFGRDR